MYPYLCKEQITLSHGDAHVRPQALQTLVVVVVVIAWNLTERQHSVCAQLGLSSVKRHRIKLKLMSKQKVLRRASGVG